MSNSLNKKWKEILFSFSGFGPNMLMVLMGAFFTDAINPAALALAGDNGKLLQTITGTCLIVPALFPILWFIAKIFDGIIDIPFASLVDNLNIKKRNRFSFISYCFIPMVVSFVLCWIPFSMTNHLANTIYFFIFSLIFFATYTMCLISFYGSLSVVCKNSAQRLRISSYKSFFDTISYIFVYALIPLILSVTGLNIDKVVFILIPTMVTILIPVFLFKKENIENDEKLDKNETDKISILSSIKLTIKNKPFLSWCVVNSCSFFALQLFLVSMNALILGGMGLTSLHMTILNTCAFAPVPLMLYLFRKLCNLKGIRFAFQTSLIVFSISILSFFVGSSYIMGDNTLLKLVIGIVGGVMGSWSIGAFFMMPYMIPTQISAIEEKLTKKNHSAMFFAAQTVFTSFFGALSTSIVYENIKTLFFSTQKSGIVNAVDKIIDGEVIFASNNAAELLGVSIDSIYNLGNLIVPLIVALFCIIGFFLSFMMPKYFSAKEIAKGLKLEKEYNENLHLFENENDKSEVESVFINIVLWILSLGVFSFIWLNQLINTVNKFSNKKIKKYHIIISIIFFPYIAYLIYIINKEINTKKKELNKELIKHPFVLNFINISFLNFISLSILQSNVNKMISNK